MAGPPRAGLDDKARSRSWSRSPVLTGYVSQQNFDAQWISTQAKDGLNADGVGSFFNVTNSGQMYSYHVFLLPLAVVAIVVAHILLVHRHGIVPPFHLSGLRRPSEHGAG